MSFEHTPNYSDSGGKLWVIGSSGTLSVKGTMTATGTLTMSGTQTLSGTATVSGSLNVSGTETVSGNLSISGDMYQAANLMTTASTGTMPFSGLTIVKSTKTAKTITIATPQVGARKSIYCLNASATGFVRVKVGTTGGRTFDGTNTVYKFLKANTAVEIILGTSGRWYEFARSVADGTALGSTTT